MLACVCAIESGQQIRKHLISVTTLIIVVMQSIVTYLRYQFGQYLFQFPHRFSSCLFFIKLLSIFAFCSFLSASIKLKKNNCQVLYQMHCRILDQHQIERNK